MPKMSALICRCYWSEDFSANVVMLLLVVVIAILLFVASKRSFIVHDLIVLFAMMRLCQ